MSVRPFRQFIGSANTRTGIKEAMFWGGPGASTGPRSLRDLIARQMGLAFTRAQARPGYGARGRTSRKEWITRSADEATRGERDEDEDGTRLSRCRRRPSRGYFAGYQAMVQEEAESDEDSALVRGLGWRLADRLGPSMGKLGFVVAGSDTGKVLIWDVETALLVATLEDDADVVNCVQPHPSLPWLATSGIEDTIRLWTPEPWDVDENPVPATTSARGIQRRPPFSDWRRKYPAAHPGPDVTLPVVAAQFHDEEIRYRRRGHLRVHADRAREARVARVGEREGARVWREAFAADDARDDTICEESEESEARVWAARQAALRHGLSASEREEQMTRAWRGSGVSGASYNERSTGQRDRPARADAHARIEEIRAGTSILQGMGAGRGTGIQCPTQ